MRAFSRAETEPWAYDARARPASLRPRNENRDSDRNLGSLAPVRAPARPAVPLAVADTAPVTRFGPYIVHDHLGSGRLSSVHRALDIRAELRGEHRPVALKRLDAAFATDWELVEAFLREGQIGHRLCHPNVARTFEYGKLDDTYYAAIELALGPTLAHVATQSRTAAGAIPTHIVVELALQICEALDHLHNQTPAIIHRDVAPSSLIVTARGRVKLIDFGVVKAAARQQTRRGTLKASAAYVAPESLDGQVDVRADLFAVGAIAHELLVGQPLFAADSEARTLRNVRSKVVQPPSRWAPEIPADLDDIVLTALQRDPSQRWHSAAALHAALATVADDLGGRDTLAGDLVAWLGWAFERMPRRETHVAELVDALEADWLAEDASPGVVW